MSVIRPVPQQRHGADHPVVLGDHVPDPAAQFVVGSSRARASAGRRSGCRAASARPRIVGGLFAGCPASAVFAVGQRMGDPGVDDQHGQAVRRPGRTGCSRRCRPWCRTAARSRPGRPRMRSGPSARRARRRSRSPRCWAIRAICSGVEVDAGQRRRGQHGRAFDGGRRGQSGAGRAPGSPAPGRNRPIGWPASRSAQMAPTR